MHRMYLCIPYLMLFLFGTGSAFPGDNRQALRFTISLEKKVFLVDESVYLEMAETNISETEVAMTPMWLGSSWGNFKIILKNVRGEELDFKGGESYDKADPNWPGFILMPGDSFVLVKDLLDVFGKWGDPSHQFSLYLPAGTYEVQAVHHTNMKAYVGLNHSQEDKQTMTSNLLTFEVVAPSGAEKQAHEELMKLMAEFNQADAAERRAMHSTLLKYINSFDNSKYVSHAYRGVLYIYRQNSSLPGRELFLQKALERFSNSRFSYVLVHSALLKSKIIKSINRTKSYDKTVLFNKINREKTLIKDDSSMGAYYTNCMINNTKIGRRGALRIQRQK